MSYKGSQIISSEICIWEGTYRTSRLASAFLCCLLSSLFCLSRDQTGISYPIDKTCGPRSEPAQTPWADLDSGHLELCSSTQVNPLCTYLSWALTLALNKQCSFRQNEAITKNPFCYWITQNKLPEADIETSNLSIISFCFFNQFNVEYIHSTWDKRAWVLFVSLLINIS